jgi:hypothetical protein
MSTKHTEATSSNINDIKSEVMKLYHFLQPMYNDSYFPKQLVDEGKAILIELCYQIESTNPKTNEELIILTHETTEKFNRLNSWFIKEGSEIETVAREAIASDIEYIAKTYGFKPDIEALISNRDW